MGFIHVGSDDVKTTRAVYEAVIRASGSKSTARGLTQAPRDCDDDDGPQTQDFPAWAVSLQEDR